jgi:hypothetical protein
MVADKCSVSWVSPGRSRWGGATGGLVSPGLDRPSTSPRARAGTAPAGVPMDCQVTKLRLYLEQGATGQDLVERRATRRSCPVCHLDAPWPRETTSRQPMAGRPDRQQGDPGNRPRVPDLRPVLAHPPRLVPGPGGGGGDQPPLAVRPSQGARARRAASAGLPRTGRPPEGLPVPSSPCWPPAFGGRIAQVR